MYDLWLVSFSWPSLLILSFFCPVLSVESVLTAFLFPELCSFPSLIEKHVCFAMNSFYKCLCHYLHRFQAWPCCQYDCMTCNVLWLLSNHVHHYYFQVSLRTVVRWKCVHWRGRVNGLDKGTGLLCGGTSVFVTFFPLSRSRSMVRLCNSSMLVARGCCGLSVGGGPRSTHTFLTWWGTWFLVYRVSVVSLGPPSILTLVYKPTPCVLYPYLLSNNLVEHVHW